MPIVHVAVAEAAPLRGEFSVVSYRDGQELERRALSLAPNPAPGSMPGVKSPFFGNTGLTVIPTEVALELRCAPEGPVQSVLRQPVAWPTFEAGATARADRQINPIDLGTILVPHDWLLLAAGQSAVIDVAVISRRPTLDHIRLRAWFEGGNPVEVTLAIEPNRRLKQQLRLPLTSRADTTTLHVSVVNGARELWGKKIHTMVVRKPPRWPVFGAIETKLRYDASVAVEPAKENEPKTFLDYNTLWDPKLNDIVVALPNGSRLAFWRGANYLPLWISAYNTGFSHQWAESHELPATNVEGNWETSEPINDKALRYSSVRVIESTVSRVHVRLTYQSTTPNYRAWGDQTAEDYYFYPDGFGTRVMSLIAPPGAVYESTEFILITPQAAFPFEVLPRQAVQALYLDGDKRDIAFPVSQADPAHLQSMVEVPNLKVPVLKETPALYRVYLEPRDSAPVIYFSPTSPRPLFAFGAFYDQGEQVTPGYWGTHWPLSHISLNRYYIHDGIYSGPAHNSLMSWGSRNPRPVSVAEASTLDALGQVRTLQERRWAWLIGKTEVSDAELLAWAESFSNPPTLRLEGARLDVPAYSQERRAMRLVAEAPVIEIRLKPATHSMNPVFELAGATGALTRVTIDGKAVSTADYAWDGRTLWLRTAIGANGADIGLRF